MPIKTKKETALNTKSKSEARPACRLWLPFQVLWDWNDTNCGYKYTLVNGDKSNEIGPDDRGYITDLVLPWYVDEISSIQQSKIIAD